MRLFAALLLAPFFFLSSQPEQIDLSKLMESFLTEKSFSVVKNIHVNWYIYAIKALLGQLGKQLFKQLKKREQNLLLQCLDEIKDERDLVYGARCLLQARKLAQLNYVGSFANEIAFLQETNELSKVETINGVQLGNYQFHRNPIPLPRINLEHKTMFQHSFLKPKKYLTETLVKDAVKEIREKVLVPQSCKQNFSVKLRRIHKKLRGIQKSGIRKRNIFKMNNLKLDISKKFPTMFTNTKWLGHAKRKSPKQSNIITMETLNSLVEPKPSQTPVQKVTKLLRVLFNDTNSGSTWLPAYKKLLKFRQNMEEKKKLPGARIYEYRLYDIVTDRKKPSRTSKNAKAFPDFLTMTYQLVDALSEKKSSLKDTEFKFLSPRFAPLMPEKMSEENRVLSPSFLSFYKDNSADNIASLPKILEKSGLGEEDRDAVMELIMDFSGAGKAIDISLEVFRKLNFFGFEGEIFELPPWLQGKVAGKVTMEFKKVTKKLDTLFHELYKSFSNEQRNDIALNGFTFLENHQIQDLLRGHHVRDPRDVGLDLEIYERMNTQQRYDAVWEKIGAIAENTTNEERRQKRQLLLSPRVLSPYMFAPVFGPSVLGPVVLSPNIFSPLILHPALFSPSILSPAIGESHILSPYVLSPFILSPNSLAPHILSPFVLSPAIINPNALSPIILSPYVLSPEVLSPATLGGTILSPSVLSPAVLTESVMMANVLSPTFMS